MHFTFTHSSGIINTDILDESGRVAYRVDTSGIFSGRTTTISRPSQHGTFVEVARIEWHRLQATIVHFAGQSFDADSFLHRTSLLSSRKRKFTGPDGRSYKWASSMSRQELEKEDNHETIAIYRRRRILLGKKANLEIFPAGMHMLDLIVLTFVFVEKKYQDRQQRAAAAATAGS